MLMAAHREYHIRATEASRSNPPRDLADPERDRFFGCPHVPKNARKRFGRRARWHRLGRRPREAGCLPEHTSATSVLPIITALQRVGMTRHRGIARTLNDRGNPYGSRRYLASFNLPNGGDASHPVGADKAQDRESAQTRRIPESKAGNPLPYCLCSSLLANSERLFVREQFAPAEPSHRDEGCQGVQDSESSRSTE